MRCPRYLGWYLPWDWGGFVMSLFRFSLPLAKGSFFAVCLWLPFRLLASRDFHEEMNNGCAWGSAMYVRSMTLWGGTGEAVVRRYCIVKWIVLYCIAIILHASLHGGSGACGMSGYAGVCSFTCRSYSDVDTYCRYTAEAGDANRFTVHQSTAAKAKKNKLNILTTELFHPKPTLPALQLWYKKQVKVKVK